MPDLRNPDVVAWRVRFHTGYGAEPGWSYVDIPSVVEQYRGRDGWEVQALALAIDGVTASQAQNSAPHEVYILDCGTDDRPSWCAVKDSPGPHGFMRPDAPKRMAVRYVRADLAGVRVDAPALPVVAYGYENTRPTERAALMMVKLSNTGDQYPELAVPLVRKADAEAAIAAARGVPVDAVEHEHGCAIHYHAHAKCTCGVHPSDVARLQDLIDTYWNIAFAEGKDGRDHDTADGAAQQCRHEINTILKRLAGVQPSDGGQP